MTIHHLDEVLEAREIREAAAERLRTALGPVQRPVLEALAGAPDGLTVTALADALGWDRPKAEQPVRTLRDRGLAAVVTYQRRAARPAAVYVITTAGRAALDAAKEAAA
jgi:DNA-binding MarR family transcriptional regulator